MGECLLEGEDTHLICFMNADQTPRRQSPIVLYATEVDFKPEGIIEHGERLTVLDLEITEEMAKQIVKELAARLDGEHVTAMRIRFTGRLVLA